MTREDVYKAIDTERDYQDRMTADPNRPDMIEDLNIAGILLAMERCLHQTREDWYYDSVPYQDTMEFVRKIAGLAVKAGEQYGMPSRD